jgi:hypothetical protein
VGIAAVYRIVRWHVDCIWPAREERMNGLRNETEERGLGKLLEPNTVLPIQFFSQRGTSRWTGEQRLMAAILEDAIAVYSKSSAPKGSKARQVLRETERWLRSRDRTWTFSFMRVCEMLSLDPVAILRVLRERRDGQSAQVASPETIPTGFATEVEYRAAVG